MGTTRNLKFWNISQTNIQRSIKLADEPDEPSVSFPVVLALSNSSSVLPDVLGGAKELASKTDDEIHQSSIRKLLDENGGAVLLKSLPLRSAQDFLQFLDNLAGEGDHAWFPYDPLAMNVLRQRQAKNVLTVNEYEKILPASVRFGVCLSCSRL